jgi:hypothetical membrane protein
MATAQAGLPTNRRIINGNFVMSKKSPGALMALLAFICAVFFTATIIFAHIATDNLELLSDTLSRYALDKHGFLLTIGFYTVGMTQLLIAFLLLRQAETKLSTAASIFLLFSGLGVIIVALFPTQLPPATIAERLPHIIGAIIQFLFFPLATLALAPAIIHRPYKIFTQLTGLVTAFLFVIMLILFFLPSMRDFAYFGLVEKTDILIINFWLIIISLKLFKLKQSAL